MSLISTERINSLKVDKSDKTTVEGKSCEYDSFFLIPWGEMQNKLAYATERAIEEGHKRGLEGNALADVKVDAKFSTYIIYNKYCLIVKGKLITLE